MMARTPGTEPLARDRSVGQWVEDLGRGDVTSRWKAAKALARAAGEAEAAVPALVGALRDPSILVRVGAAETLSGVGSRARAAIPALIEALEDRYATVREMAAEALGQVGAGASAIARLGSVAGHDENKYVRERAAEALTRIVGALGPEALPELLPNLAHEVAAIRALSAGAVARFGEAGRPALPALRRLLVDEDPHVRLAAAEALAALEPKSRLAIPVLLEAADSDDETLRTRAASALDRIDPEIRGPATRQAPAPDHRDDRAGGEPGAGTGEPWSVGLPGELGWRFPNLLHLGRLESGARTERILRVAAPSACRLEPLSPGLSVEPGELAPGAHEVVLGIDPPGGHESYRGELRLVAASMERRIAVEFQAVPPGTGAAPTARQVAWQPADWRSIQSRSRLYAAPHYDLVGTGLFAVPGVELMMAEPAEAPEAWDDPIVSSGADPGAHAEPSYARQAGAGRAPGRGRELVAVPRPALSARVADSPGRRRSGAPARRPWFLPAAVLTLLGLLALKFLVSLRPPDQVARRPRPTRPVVLLAGPPAGQPAPATPEPTDTAAPVGSTEPPPSGRSPVIASQSGVRLVRVEPGEFTMGSSGAVDPKDAPAHRVRITRPFALGQCEVTQEEWRRVMNGPDDDPNPSWFSPEAGGSGRAKVAGQDTRRHPVESVSWLDAVRYCNRLSEREGLPPYYRVEGDRVEITEPGGLGYRLPTEAEWEYACRAGTTTAWYFGDSASALDDHAWTSADSDERTHQVGRRRASPLGLHDVYGNVWEWCWDWDGPYSAGATSDPQGPRTGRYRILRGGAWNTFEPDTGSARRNAARPDERHKDTGFRVARTVPPDAEREGSPAAPTSGRSAAEVGPR
jgi:formylglycine-generating enzyme required for sulfatase activity